jgi:hypothetical protein
MTTHTTTRVLRPAVIAAAALAVAAVAAGSAALASPGCDAVNAKAFDRDLKAAESFSETVSTFAIGDSISFKIKCPGWRCRHGELIWSLTSGNGTRVSESIKNPKGALYDMSGAQLLYTVTGTEHDTTLTFSMFWFQAAQLHSTCTPAGTKEK